MSVGQWLESWDLILGTLFFSRLLFYILWDKFSCVAQSRQIASLIYQVFGNILSVVVFGAKVIKDTYNQLLLYFFNTTEVRLDMADILDRKLECGTGEPGGKLGRVHIDKACVQLHAYENSSDIYQVLTQNYQCYGCPKQQSWESPELSDLSNTEVNGTYSFQVQTRYSTLLEVIKNKNSTNSCSTSHHFEQYGVYQLDLDTCNISVLDKPVNAFLPIFWAFVFLCLLAGLRLAYQSVYKTAVFRRFLVWLQLRSESPLLDDQEAQNRDQDTAQLLETAEAAAKKARRVKSLDAFRGLAITIMIFVNYGGGSYYFFNHSPWNGLTVADLVFPWFIWIMGVSLAISTQSQLRNSVPRKRIVLRVIKRSLILVFLGLIINSEGQRNDLKTMRFPGVLQRFGVTYMVVGVMESILLPRQYPDISIRGAMGPFLDLTTSVWQWLAALICVALHTTITFQLPVPGCPTGYLGPGGLAENMTHQNCTGGAAMWVDVSVFGSDHIYQHPSSTPIYHGVAHDPEGLLGTLTSIVLCWMGVAAGRVLLVHQEWQARVKRWLVWGSVCGILALSLAGCSQNNGVIPINKNLWSISFIMATGSMAFILLTTMYLLIDVYRFWSGSPLYFPGMNSILLYMGHEICSGMFPWSWKPLGNSHAELLAMNMWGCGLWVLTSYMLYRKKMFLAL